MKKIVLFLALFIAVWTSASLAEPILGRPYWSLELKGGRFVSDIDTWSSSYGGRASGQFGGALAYKFLRWAEAGIEGGGVRASGAGIGEEHQEQAGNVTLNLYPLDVFVLVRGVFSENQWLVPYVGGGWTKMYYKTEIKYQGVARGSVDGNHARAGLQLLLDVLDPQAANNMFRDYGVHHTYLFLEAKRTRTDAVATGAESVNIGGTSYQAGLLFEF